MNILDSESPKLGRKLVSSFRDPAGVLVPTKGRIVRIVRRAGLPNAKAFANSQTARNFQKTGQLVGTREISIDEARSVIGDLGGLVAENDIGMILEHERIPFPSFVYEWAPEMLHAAGRLHLDLAESLIKEGLGLKDATPFNVLFKGPKPVFIDALSFEPRDPGDSIWLPYSQFVRTILMPLLMNRSFGVGLDTLLTKQDGLWPAEVSKHYSGIKKLLPPALTLVTIPSWLSSKGENPDTKIHQRKTLQNTEKARFILDSLFSGLSRNLKRVSPAERTSMWTDYAAEGKFDPEYVGPKKSFVERVFGDLRPKSVLDIGCNTGEFSMISAKSGANVVSIDSDAAVVGRLWQKSRKDGLSIHPIVMDISRPTPSIGWHNSEYPSFLERANGAFDAVLMLAVIHHLVTSAGVPLKNVVVLASELTTDALIAEFVPPDDPMFKSLSRGRDELFTPLTREFFEQSFSQHFRIVESKHLAPTGRWIYLMRKRNA